MTKVYSPYLTEQYLTCPRLYAYGKRWQPRTTAWTPHLLLGSAIAKGLATVRKGLDGDPEAEMATVIEKGFPPMEVAYTESGLLKLAKKGLELGLRTDLGTIIAVEQPMGGFRPDAVARDHQGRLIVWDDKVKLNQNLEYLSSTLEQFNTEPQVWRYAQGVSDYYGELVHEVRINFIILSPKQMVEVHPIPVTQEALDQWRLCEEDAFEGMAKIDAGGVAIPRYTSCRGRYGRCRFYQGCHTYYGREEHFPTVYDRVERGD